MNNKTKTTQELQDKIAKLENENQKLKYETGSPIIGWWTYLPRKKHLFLSFELMQYIGLNAAKNLIRPEDILKYIHQEDHEKLKQIIANNHAEKKSDIDFTVRVLQAGDGYYKVKIKLQYLNDQENQDLTNEPIQGTVYKSNYGSFIATDLNSINSKYRTIFNHSNDSIFLNYLTPKKPGNFIEVNHTAVKTFGYTQQEFQLLDPSKILIFKKKSRFDALWSELMENKKVLFEIEALTKSGKTLTVEVNSVILTIDNQYVLLSVSRNITERKKAELELIKAQKVAQQSEELKNAFLANISHEIRTPMNAIAGFSTLLANDQLDKKTKNEYADIINTNTNLLLRLITDIIDLSKIETGILKIIKYRVELNQVLKYLFNIFKSELHRLSKNHIQLKYIKELPDGKDFILSDPLRLNQVLYNLIFNAIKYTEKGFVEFGYKLQGNDILFFVKDSGIGIVKEKQDVIFDHFRQANDAYTLKNHGGTGLGLSISKKLVERLGGKIWLESESKVGSTFYFTLPNVYIKPLNNNKHEIKPNWCGKTILIINESEEIVNFFNLIFFETSVNLLIARTGEEAMHLTRSNANIELAIIHYTLPDISPFASAKIVRNNLPNAKLVLTTDTKSNLKETSDFFDDTISNVFDEEEVYNVLNTHF